MSRNVKLALGCGALTMTTVVCLACAAFGYGHYRQEQATWGALGVACEGRPVPGAAPFVPGPGVHGAIVAARGLSGGFDASSFRTPSAWLSRGVSDAQLVICVGAEETESVGTCTLPYTSGAGRSRRTRLTDFARTRQKQSYRLVAATTGQLVAETTLRSEDPIECAKWTGSNPQVADFEATISPDALEQWLVRAADGGSDAAFKASAATRSLVGGIGGGPQRAEQFSASCMGSIPAEPQHVIQLDAPTHLALSVLPDRDVDMTLTIQASDGSVSCNDDHDGNRPALELNFPAGPLRVFVGSYSAADGNPPYRLRVSSTLPR
jgi:hypothetical protein